MANTTMDVRNNKTCHERIRYARQARDISKIARIDIEIIWECGLEGGGLCCKESHVNIRVKMGRCGWPKRRLLNCVAALLIEKGYQAWTCMTDASIIMRGSHLKLE